MSKRIPVEKLITFDRQNKPDPNYDYSKGAAFLVDKPRGWTSFDIVKLIRSLTGAKTGHAGTLDPMAEGLLILCCGKATKSIKFFQQRDKYYDAEITFGASTPSYDAEMKVDEEAPFDHITSSAVRDVLQEQFIGDIIQYPPDYSAVKKDGKRLYEWAREGKKVKKPPRIVTIHDIQLLSFESPKAELRIKCGGGTYIRSIAHDLGKALNSRGYLTRLVRTAIGEFDNRQALTPDQIKKVWKNNG